VVLNRLPEVAAEEGFLSVVSIPRWTARGGADACPGARSLRPPFRRPLLGALLLLLPLLLAACQGGSRPPSFVTNTSAQFNGYLLADKGDAYYYFQYGTTTGYGSATPTRTVPSGQNATIAETVTGLAPATTYHWRMCGNDAGKGAACDQDRTFTTVADDPVVAAAGDIACDTSDPAFNGGAGTSSTCKMMATSNLLVGAGFSAVLALGDTQYDCGSPSDYAASYDPSWGRVKQITLPVPGNHEYKTADPDAYGGHDCDTTGHAAGYYGYFGSAAGDPSKGYYSYDLGTWHIVVLNTTSACSLISCSSGSAQEQWLANDLAAHPAQCTMALWHEPRWSSKLPSTKSSAFWTDLYNANADVVVNGHVHDYERFAPQSPAGAPDPTRGIREFVAGTGGKSSENIAATPAANSEVQGKAYGVLKLTLHASSYDWQFAPATGSSFTDSGSAACH